MTDPRALQAIRQQAFCAVMRGETDPAYAYRKATRWYAERYHVSPFEVEDLPPEHIWQVYWEVQYEQLRDRDQGPGAFLAEGHLLVHPRAAERPVDAVADADDYVAKVAAEEARKELSEVRTELKGSLQDLAAAVRGLPDLRFDQDDDEDALD